MAAAESDVVVVLPTEPPTPMQRVLWRQILGARAPGLGVERVHGIETAAYVGCRGNYGNYMQVMQTLDGGHLSQEGTPTEVVARARTQDTLFRAVTTAADTRAQPWDNPTIPFDQAAPRRLRCRPCGSRDIDVSFRQSRGGDEGMTCYATCGNCSAEWCI